MKSSRSKLWIIVLGGVIGLAFGLVGSYLSLDEGWKRLSYPAFGPTTERAVKLRGYDSRDGTLYVQGQSQTVYGCPAEPYRENSDCHRVTTEAVLGLVSCPGLTTRHFDDPPGKVISKMIVFDCRYNEYWIVQSNYAVLDDGSLWQLTYNSFSAGLRNCVIIPGALMGIVIGALIGALIFGSTRTTSKT